MDIILIKLLSIKQLKVDLSSKLKLVINFKRIYEYGRVMERLVLHAAVPFYKCQVQNSCLLIHDQLCKVKDIVLNCVMTFPKHNAISRPTYYLSIKSAFH